MGKTVIVYELIFIFTLIGSMILLTQVKLDSNYSNQVIIVICALIGSILTAILGLIFSYRNNNLLNSYIGYNNTLIDLTDFGFVCNGEILKSFKVLRIKNEIKLEINGTWKKYQTSQLKKAYFEGAKVFGKVGHIKFNFQENQFELIYKKTKTDIVSYALYYNLIRKIAK
ncbi:hypothetical protein [Spiroplasma floricola]|uniref:Uncharacterized protein n=1 Tax=Spiroplasma floricola 23-6 TaxID=1336749 RepID=A0A2K8SFD7_9MOLU|nr:hypothetical protein [Spiroplasma floricola]AUB32065.1 hypothetical protein SFLOR_v1c10190 [Spiroplasma floricola 23-6]